MSACDPTQAEKNCVFDAAMSDFRESLIRVFAFLATLFIFLTLFCPSR